MQFIGMPRGRRLADLSALTIAFVICLAVIVFSWPKDRLGESDIQIAKCCEVQTAELEPAKPGASASGTIARDSKR